MATLQGFTDGSTDYKHMYNIKDLHGKPPVVVYPENTILGILQQLDHPFYHIITTNALCSLFTDTKRYITLIIPSQQCFSKELHIDIIRKHTLPFLFNFKQQYGYQLNSMYPAHQWYVGTSLVPEKEICLGKSKIVFI